MAKTRGGILLPLLKVIAVSLPLTWIWLEWGREAYGWFFTRTAIPIFGMLGETSLLPVGARDRFINYLPFLILMLVTPRMSWARRSAGIAIGFVAIYISHLIFVWYTYHLGVDAGRMSTGDFRQIFPVLMLSDALPLILWVIFANQFVRESLGHFLPGPAPKSKEPRP